MLLRRVIEHTKAQNWTAIAIDFAIVVFGVFVGIQVANWNDEINAHRKAEVFSARLMNDLRLEAWAFEQRIEYIKDLLKNTERTLAALSGDSSASDEELLISAYRASNYGFAERWRATYEELVATGEIGLIDDAELLETAIVVYNTPVFDLIVEDGKESEFRELFRKSIPIKIQTELLESCGDRNPTPLNYDEIVDMLDYECSLELPAGETAAAATMLRESDYSVPALRFRFADIQTALYLLTEYSKPQRDALKKLRSTNGLTAVAD